ncbi:MAG: KEOPS complex subunit Cgi121 [Methanocalculaceae archaeon]|jgi:KEOPS complex subunit Cgi121|nr:KEOPS complex subunit Cgi121 [Methanocalculaceae archaeon]
MEKSLKIYEAIADISDTATTIREVNAIAERTNSTIVLFNAEKIAGLDHVLSAVRHAERSFASGKPIARTLAMGILLYASGQRQCSLAPRFGLHAERNYLLTAVIGGDTAAAKELLAAIIVPKEHGVTAPIPVLMEEFGITEAELEITGTDRMEELVIERVAMVDVYM